MLDQFWGSIGSDLAKRWLDYLFGPAFLFWATGAGLYLWRMGWQQKLQMIQSLTEFQQITWILLLLLLLLFSSVLMKSLRFPVLRFLEGYWPWPFNYLGMGLTGLHRRSYQKKYNELRRLKALESKGELDDRQRERLGELESWAHWSPARANELMPTALGNILRARERGPERRYGLDAVICWPRIWPLLASNVREDLTAARGSLDSLAELWFWGLLLLLWVSLSPWVILISVLWMITAYMLALQAAMTYGELLEAAFD
ncbi:MAG: hypothetical protein ACM3PS_16765, partial [Syntrophothermus sp.]